MSDHGRNATGVSTGYVRATVPASAGSSTDNPPPYSACVPNPPAFNSNDPKTHSSLLIDPPAYTPTEISNHGSQTGNYLHEVRPCAPFLDLPSTSESPPGVHDPRVSSYNSHPALETTRTAIQGNPPPYRHEQKTIVLRRTNNRTSIRRRSIGLCVAMAVAIAIATIIIAGMISRVNKTRRINYLDFNSGSYNREIPDVYRETEVKTDFTNLYKDDFHTLDFGDGTKINLFDFDALQKHMNEILNSVDVKSGETENHSNLEDQADYASNKNGKDKPAELGFDPKFTNILDLSKILPSVIGNQNNHDAFHYTDIIRSTKELEDIIRSTKELEDILRITRNEKTNENVEKPASGDDPLAASTIIPNSDGSDLTE